MAIRQFNVFVEGNDDHDLLLTLVQQQHVDARPSPTIKSKRGATYLDLPTLNASLLIFGTDGWTNLPLSKNQLAQAVNSNGRNLIIFDADYDKPEYPEGGPVKRAVELRRLVTPFDPNPAIYLLPGPDRNGNIETLLLELTHPDHAPVLKCYDVYERCLQDLRDPVSGEPYKAPFDKRRVYDYVNVLPLPPEERERHQEKGGQKIFENPRWWDLIHPAIQPLRDFLDQYIR